MDGSPSSTVLFMFDSVFGSGIVAGTVVAAVEGLSREINRDKIPVTFDGTDVIVNGKQFT